MGLAEYEMGPLVWRRQHTFNWAGRRICQRERYYMIHVERFAPRMSDPYEAKVVEQFRWRSLAAGHGSGALDAFIAGGDRGRLCRARCAPRTARSRGPCGLRQRGETGRPNLALHRIAARLRFLLKLKGHG